MEKSKKKDIAPTIRDIRDYYIRENNITNEQLPMVEKSLNLPSGRLGTPQDLGAAALYLLAPASEWVTGQVIRISGGM